MDKGDNISARTKIKLGSIFRKKLTFFKCVDKIIFKIDVCPHCKSGNTYHKRRLIGNWEGLGYCDNVYRSKQTESTASLSFHKIDYCLDCHKEFSIEIFCYEKIPLLKYLKIGRGK